MPAPSLDATALLALLADPGSFVAWDDRPEAVRTGAARVGGHPVAVVVSDFGYRAGSVGHAAAARLVAAFDRAAAEGLPLLVSPASGGTRMEEGTGAFLEMVAIAAAIARHKSARVPLLAYLRGPTTGGVLASWGSAAHLTFAEPGATIGFLGPRVCAGLTGVTWPPEVQTAENLAAHGVVDGVVSAARLRDVIGRCLRVVAAGRRGPSRSATNPVPLHAGADACGAWESVLATRRAGRPGVRELLTAASDVVELAGSAEGHHDPAVVVALCRFGARGCVLLGHDRTALEPVGADGLRVLRRGVRLAVQLGVPVVTAVDTAGAALTRAAEESGLAGQIARCLGEFVTAEVPTLAVLLGQGAGGAALPLLAADRVLAARHGWLAPLPPEGASLIVYRDTAHAPELARRQGIRAADLAACGVVDRIVPEIPDAADEPHAFAARLAGALAEELATLAHTGAHRTARFHRARLGYDLVSSVAEGRHE